MDTKLGYVMGSKEAKEAVPICVGESGSTFKQLYIGICQVCLSSLSTANDGLNSLRYNIHTLKIDTLRSKQSARTPAKKLQSKTKKQKHVTKLN